MRTIIAILATILMIATLLPQRASAQSPEKMSYQAVIRDANNNLVLSQTIGMQISILQGSAGGTAAYVETQTPSTNSNGLVSIELGGGTVVSGDFATINWGNGPYFIKTETDPTGGTTYTITSTNQLLSVPYSLYAETAGSLIGGITESQNLADVLGQNNDANSIQIKNIADPTDDQDAVTMAYVEERILGILISSNIDDIDNQLFSANSDGGSNVEIVRQITTDASGNVYVAGQYSTSTTLGSTTLTSAGGTDIFLAKYDGSGNLLWAKSAGGSLTDKGLGISTDPSGNVYVSGYFQGTATFGSTTLTTVGGNDVFLAKYDVLGNFIWVKSAGGTANDIAHRLSIDGTGYVYVIGEYQGTAIFESTTLTSAGNYDIFLAKYDGSGNLVWVKSAGGTSDDYGYGVSTDASGNAFITGVYGGTATFGSSTLTVAGGTDAYFAKYDASGSLLWVKSAGGALLEEGQSITNDASGNVYVTGFYQGTASFESSTLTSEGEYDIYFAKYDGSGNLIWLESAGGSSTDKGLSIASDESGYVYLTGSYMGTVTFGSASLTSEGDSDVYLAKYDDSGNLLWVKSAGGSLADQGSGVTIDGSGNVYVAGWFHGTATFGSNTLTAAGSYDMFIWKYIN